MSRKILNGVGTQVIFAALVALALWPTVSFMIWGFGHRTLVVPAEASHPRVAARPDGIAPLRSRLAAAAEGSLHMADVPLPPPAAVCAARTASARKKAVRAALLRWHPDKFKLSKFSSEDRGAVAEAVADVCQRVYKEKKKLAR